MQTRRSGWGLRTGQASGGSAFDCAPVVMSDAIGQAGCLCHRPGLAAVSRKLNAAMSRRGFVAGLAGSLATLRTTMAQSPQTARPRRILFTNFRLFDGRGTSLRDGLTLLVEGDRIAALDSGNPGPVEGARVYDCGGRTLMPGLIDAHWHALLAGLPMSRLLTADAGYIYLAAAQEAERTLMRGFTSVRDLGGPVFPLKQAIDDGLVAGPRIYASGAMITTTGGHGDLRSLSEVPRSAARLSEIEKMGAAMIADSEGDVRLRAREQLMLGASQIKLVAGGGVSSPRSPLDMTTFSETELSAGIGVARDWNTYAAVHAYASHTIRRALAAGAVCIEHGHLMDAAIARTMAERGVWLSTQPFLSAEDSVPLTGPQQDRLLQVVGGTDTVYRLAREHGIRTAFGSDLLFSPEMAARQGTMLGHLARWYTNGEALRMATGTNAELLALSGPRNPYPAPLGVIEAGAFADLLVVDGDPVADLSILAAPERSLRLIMKGGGVYKDRLTA